MSAFATTAASWQNFYLLVGTAAATLIGLMFVAITFGATAVKAIANVEASRAFIDPTLTHFVQVLMTACFVVIPSMGSTLFGVLLVAMAAIRIAAIVGIHRHMKAAARRNNDIELSDWLSGIIIPVATYLLLAGSGFAFIMGRLAFAGVAIATIVILLNGIYGAWELVVWLALTRSRTD